MGSEKIKKYGTVIKANQCFNLLICRRSENSENWQITREECQYFTIYLDETEKEPFLVNPLEKAPDLPRGQLITDLTKEVTRLRESALPTIKHETPGVMTLEEQLERLSLDTQKNPLKRTITLK